MGTSAITFDPSTAIPLSNPVPNPRAAALQSAAAFGVQQDPTAYAHMLDLQKRIGIPPLVSQGNEDQVKQAADLHSLNAPQFAVANPRTAAWASNPDNAAVSGVDELHRQAGIEQHATVMRAYTPTIGDKASDALYSLGQWMMGGTISKDQLRQNFWENPVPRAVMDTASSVAGMAGNVASFVGWHGDAGKPNLLQRIEANLDPANQGVYAGGEADEGTPLDVGAKFAGPLVAGGAAGIALKAAGLAAGLSNSAATVLSGLGVGGLFTAEQGGKTYTAVKGGGGSDYDARLKANRVAAINALPNALFGATELPLLERYPLLTSVGIGAATGASGQLAQNVVTGQSWDAGMLSATAQGAAVQGGMHIGMGSFAGELGGAVAKAEASQLRERAPDKFEEANQAIFEGDASLRIPAEQFSAYFTSKGMDPAGVAKGLGSTNYADALHSGGDVEVPPAAFLSKLDPEHQKALLPDVVDPSTGLTARQHEQGRAELQEWLNGGGAAKLQEDTAAADAETAAMPEYQGVKEQLRQRYVDAGESPEVAETLAEKDANAYSNIARNVGMKPSELLQMYNPKVRVGEAPGGEGPRVDYAEALTRKIDADPTGAIAEYNGLDNTDGGRILNTDEARELSEHYREDRTRSADVHEPASTFVKDLYAKKLAAPVTEGREPLVLFTAGGTGAGKSSALKTPEGAALQSRADIIYDTNMNNVESSEKKIQQALDSGRDVHIQYVYRDPVEALTGGALPRAMRMGRTVPLAEHIKTHVGSRSAMDALQAKYADDPRVSFSGVDNSLGRDKQKAKDIDLLPQVEEDGLRERLQNALDAEHAAGRISEAVRNGTAGTQRDVHVDADAGSSRRSGGVQPEPSAADEGVDRSDEGRDAGEFAAEQPGRVDQRSQIAGVDGRDTSLLTPSGKLPATYVLVEASDLIASHNHATFEKDPRYPDGVQERAYDTSKEAQARVVDQAQNYEPAYTVNTNPDAVNGPPVITRDGIVLGGNSRTMSTIRLYRDGNGDVYRDALKRSAEAFGLTQEAVGAMKEPVLVRRVQTDGSQDSLRRLGTDLNRSMTGALGAAEKAVSAGKNLKPETLRSVSSMLQDGDYTLREMMTAQGPRLVQMMVGDGVITDRERPQYVDPATGGLNEAGKSFVERALLGSVIDNPRLMEDAPKSVLNKIERSLGPITSFSSRADEWNILPAIRAAVGELGSIQREGSTVDLRTVQTSIFGDERSPLVDAMIRALDGKPNAVKDAFEIYSKDADANLPGQSRMFGEAEAFEAFNHAFGSKLTEQEYHDGLEQLAGPDAKQEAVGDTGVDGRVSEASAGSAGAGGAQPDRSAQSEQELAPGATLNQSSADGARGWFRVLPDGSYEIGKTKFGDLSTFVHEPAHAYLHILGDLARRDEASDVLKDDYRKVLDYLGAKDGEPLTREQQEKWAQANEQYLREGRAPSAGLKGTFQRFAIWLGNVYKKASDLGVTLSDDIRGVFDRLYASESGVDKAEAEGGPKLFTSAEEAGWTEDEFKNYADAKGMGVEQAKSEILGKLNEAALREKTASWLAEEKNVRTAVTAEVDASPQYAAIRSLRRGTMDDGTMVTMDRAGLVEQFGEDRVKELQKRHPGLYRNEGGYDPETAAEMLGFGSAHDLMMSLEEVPRRSETIDTMTRGYMTAKHGDIRYDGTLDDQARIALENDKRSEALYSELRALKKKLAQAQEQAGGRKSAMRNIEVAPIASYREAAHGMIESKAVADLQPTRYLDASRKYSREAFDALRRGDAGAAAEAKHKELLNHFLFREAREAKDYVGRFESYAKRMQSKGVQGKIGLAGSDYREQFNHLLFRYGLSGAPAEGPQRTLSQWADALYNDGKEAAIDPSIFDESRVVSYRQASVAEVRALHDALINIRHLAAQELGMEVNGRKVEFNAAIENMVVRARQSIEVKPRPVFDENRAAGQKVTDLVGRGAALLKRTEFLMKELDGGTSGPWHDTLWHLASDSQGKESDLNEAVTKQVGDALRNMPTAQRARLLDKVAIDGITEPVTRRRMLAMAFNMGNEGNLDRLEKTFIANGWEPRAIEQIKRTLTREEWGFVQGVWDSLKPLGQAQAELEKRLTGLPPVMVRPTPLRIDHVDGTSTDLAGGYYPIVMDPKYSARGAQQDAGMTAQNMMEAGYGRAVTSRGNMKERTGFGGPLLMDYEQVLTQHTAKVIKDISHREFMLTANKVLLDPAIRQTLRETVGESSEAQMMPWLRTIINNRNGSTIQGLGDVSRAMSGLRTNVVKAALGFKFSTLLLQLTHASSVFLHTSPLSYAQAMVDFMAHPKDMTEQIKGLSPNEMASRGDNLDRDMRKILQDGVGTKSLGDMWAKAGMAPVQMMDHLLSFPLWLSVYREALGNTAELSDPDSAEAKYQAMQKADGAVRMGLGSNAPKDLAPIMRNHDLTKLLTTMGGFHNLKWNQMAGVANSGGGIGKVTYGMVMAGVIPAVLGAYISGRGPKDDENAGAWAAKRALLFPAETIAILNIAVEAMENHGDMRYSPIASMAERTAKDGAHALSDSEDKDWTGMGMDTLQTTMEGMGVSGTDQAFKVGRYVRRAQQGKVDNPNPWDAVVGAPQVARR